VALLIDQTDVRIPGRNDANIQSVSVQGVYNLKLADDVVQLDCQTYAGNAQEAWLTAIKVDKLNLPCKVKGPGSYRNVS
jgi:hypothetical protein